MASEQIAKDRNEQPEPNDENEYCECIHQKVSISKSLLKEEHGDIPCFDDLLKLNPPAGCTHRRLKSIYCESRAPLAHFLLLATRSRSLREALVCAAAGSAMDA